MSINWNHTLAAVWRPHAAGLRAVRRLDPIRLDDLLGIDAQKGDLVRNTEDFLAGRPARNALLWGSRGTGKSSLVKALLNDYAAEGLRVIEIDKADLADLPDVVDGIHELPQRFIVFCDDLSFEADETLYKHLKSVLEGSIELPPENVLVYATSNRRHLVAEPTSDNQGVAIVAGELHYGDAIEEKLSLADRFGLWLSFYPNSQEQYLAIVDHLCGDDGGDRAGLHLAARQFAMTRASRSGRTARQFANAWRNRSAPAQA
ncbi:MAG: ATP-binding protein [Porticoccaceae bacterium]